MAPNKEMSPDIKFKGSEKKEGAEIDPLIDELARLVDGIYKKSSNPSKISSETSPERLLDIKDLISQSRGKIEDMKAIVSSTGELWKVLDVLDDLLGQMLDGNKSVAPSRLPFLVETLRIKCGNLMKFKSGPRVT